MLFRGRNPLSRFPERPLSPSEAAYHLSECRWEGIESKSIGVKSLAHQAPVALSVVFSDESGNLFSAARIILCCSRELHDKKWRDWAIQDMGSVVDTAERLHSVDPTNSTRVTLGNSTPLNDPRMPKCIVIFEMIDHQESASGPVWLGPALRASRDPQFAQQCSILFDREIPLPPDTLAVTLSFITHFTGTCTLMDTPLKLQPIAHHFVDVLPIATTSRQILYKELPVEILLKIFQYITETPNNRDWRRDLLSSALVCRQWTCSLDLLLCDLHLPYDHHHWVTKPPDIRAVAKMVTERPVLARSVNHLNTYYFRGPTSHLKDDSASLPAFTSSLISILGSSRNLRTLELTHLDVSQMEALGNILCDLPSLHTFTTGQGSPAHPGVISIVQLAYCLASWPSLKSLTIHGLQPPTTTETTVPLRPPACNLTELHLEKVFMTDAELMYFTTPSFETLETVTLDGITISDAGLRTFLEGISQNVSNLTLRNVGRMHGTEERALDAVIVQMRCLKQLFIKGNVATELMVSRRASLFSTSRSSPNKSSADGASLPVIRLFFDLVSGLPATIADDDWPGWDIIKPYMGPRGGGVHRGFSMEEYRALNSRPEGYLGSIHGHGLACQSTASSAT